MMSGARCRSFCRLVRHEHGALWDELSKAIAHCQWTVSDLEIGTGRTGVDLIISEHYDKHLASKLDIDRV